LPIRRSVVAGQALHITDFGMTLTSDLRVLLQGRFMGLLSFLTRRSLPGDPMNLAAIPVLE